MTDSRDADLLDRKHAGDRSERLESIRRWVEYIETHPPEDWGPQQNAVVDGQLEAAQNADVSAQTRRRVRSVAADIQAEPADADDDS